MKREARMEGSRKEAQKNSALMDPVPVLLNGPVQEHSRERTGSLLHSKNHTYVDDQSVLVGL